MKEYDWLIVGAGLFGATFAYELKKKYPNVKICVVERNKHIGGLCYTEDMQDIQVHKYGAHIFKTNNKDVWDFVNQFYEFVPFVNSPLANYKGDIYNLPFNMNTFKQLWNVTKPEDASKIIQSQCVPMKNDNLKDYALSVVGKDIYEKFIEGYTSKQWNTTCDNLPKEILGNVPLRYTYDNNYYNYKYQGIPSSYTNVIARMLSYSDAKIILDADGRDYMGTAEHILYTGPIDELFDYRYGELPYRPLTFIHKTLPITNYQGNAVVNYTDYETPYTRVIEHKHFYKTLRPDNVTVVTYEFPCGDSRYYPIETQANKELYSRYLQLLDGTNIYVGGRLGLYRYLDMAQVVELARELANKIYLKSEVRNEN